MAKVQSRRGVSLNRAVHDQLSRVCAARGIAMASVVERLIKQWLELGTFADGSVPIVPDEVVVGVTARPAQKLPAIDTRKAAEALKADYEARAAKNPCRRERCGILGLHPAHDGGAA